MKRLAGSILVTAILFACSVQAAQVQFTGDLVFIDDRGGSIFSSPNTPTTFSGQFTYGDSAAEATFIETDPEESSYGFVGSPFNADLSGGTSTPVNTQLRMDIEDDVELDVFGVSLFVGLFGASSDFADGAPYDNWNMNAWPIGADVDPDGSNDPDPDFFEGGGVFFSIDVSSFDNSLYTSTDYAKFPPGLGGRVYGRFRVVERAADGTLLFDATGALSTLTNVPLPAAAWLFPAGLIAGIGWMRRRTPT